MDSAGETLVQGLATGAAASSAPVGHASAGITLRPICFGHIDLRIELPGDTSEAGCGAAAGPSQCVGRPVARHHRPAEPPMTHPRFRPTLLALLLAALPGTAAAQGLEAVKAAY